MKGSVINASYAGGLNFMSNDRSVLKMVDSVQTMEGGGFPVRRPFPTPTLSHIDPFLLLDHMGPVDWKPGEAIGAPDHPHRGFETVTYLLQGRMEHRDSVGNAGSLGPGDVQWMTAGSGVIHSEMPEKEFTRKGGIMNGFQVWVNLPKRDKMMKPRYQEIPGSKIPQAQDDKVKVRVIAGEAMGVRAVIETRTPIQYLHYTIKPGGETEQTVAPEYNVFAYVISGTGWFGEKGGRTASRGQSVLFDDKGDKVRFGAVLESKEDLELLLLAGIPLNEPIARYGPFVMNTKEEINQTLEDYRSGKLGEIK